MEMELLQLLFGFGVVLNTHVQINELHFQMYRLKLEFLYALYVLISSPKTSIRPQKMFALVWSYLRRLWSVLLPHARLAYLFRHHRLRLSAELGNRFHYTNQLPRQP